METGGILLLLLILTHPAASCAVRNYTGTEASNPETLIEPASLGSATL